MNCRRKYESNGLPYCALKKDCVIPMYCADGAHCKYLLNSCIFYNIPIDSDYLLEWCEHFGDEISEFIDYIITGGENVKVKQRVFGRYARRQVMLNEQPN